tara:strand:- start:3047 stop:3970 length:924 start_codon:yes stop_codon:yes gene_type:complete
MDSVQLHNVSKTIGSTVAVNESSFSVKEGELFGFVGPDGAGKTTLFRILTTLLIPDSGSATVLGLDVEKDYKQIRPMLGYMPGKFSLYQDLSVQENMEFFASVFNTTIRENYELVEPIYQQLEKFKDRFAGNLSGGMKQKLALCCALIHKPKLLLLDEPTTGVDAVSRKEFWEMLAMLKKEGITIIVSTPYMDEAEQCDRVALIDKGKILKIDTPESIAQSFSKSLFGIKHEQKFKLIQTLRAFRYAESVHPFGESIHYTDQRKEFKIEELQSYLGAEGLEGSRIEQITPNIEDVFMELMQKEEVDA